MTMDIWLILPYGRAWEKALPHDIAWKKDQSYTWYVYIYQVYIGLNAKYIVYKRI